jgi:hypothetical protein
LASSGLRLRAHAPPFGQEGFVIRTDTSLIYKLTVDPVGGADLYGVCKQAFFLSDELHIPVEVIHNDRRYKVGLSIQEVPVEKSQPEQAEKQNEAKP